MIAAPFEKSMALFLGIMAPVSASELVLDKLPRVGESFGSSCLSFIL